MLPRKKTWLLLAVPLVVGSVGMALAQSGEALPEAPEVTTPEDQNLSPQQQVERTGTYLDLMEKGAGTVRRQLEQARAARDVVKTLCLNDKLAQIEVSIRSARDRGAALNAAASGSDVERANHEFMVILVLRDRVRSLLAEANQCIGEETGFIDDDMDVKVEIDPGIPDDPSDYPTDVLIITPPTLSSPIQ